MRLSSRLTAEFVGTFWLVFAGVGSAIFAAAFPKVGIGLLGVSLAFGLTVITMAYSIGRISGCHLNPAVSIGLWAGGRFPGNDVGPYVAAQVLGSVFASGLLTLVAQGKPGFRLAVDGLAANGYGVHSPGGYALMSGMTIELVMTFMFLFVIMGATHTKAPAGFAPLAIGLALTLIHLVSIPITNASVNPARSTGPALLMGGWALSQLWMFWVAPVLGGVLGGLAFRAVSQELPERPDISGDPRSTV